MSEPRFGQVAPVQQSAPKPDALDNSGYRALKVLGFLIVMLGPGLPLTIWLWRLATGG